VSVFARLADRLGDRVTLDAPSADFTTYRCGGPFAALVRAGSVGDLAAVADARATAPGVPVLVVGRGSNLLVADAGFPGVAVVLGGDFEALTVDADAATVAAGGAVPLPVLARRAAAAGIGGLEFLVGIPGSVGGAVRMNAGGHGTEIRDVLRAAGIFDLASGESRTVSPEDLGFAFRTSAVAATEVVVDVRLFGVQADPAAAAARIDEIVRWRRENQPGGQNAGSVFRNPPGDAAGRIIDACGLKGLRVGAVEVSTKHANFFSAGPGARADDVYALVLEVRSRVEAATGVRLEPEVRFVGFGDGAVGRVG